MLLLTTVCRRHKCEPSDTDTNIASFPGPVQFFCHLQYGTCKQLKAGWGLGNPSFCLRVVEVYYLPNQK